jgi:nucleotide-binding universal stress UspA family protein
MYASVLVPLDGSEAAAAALPCAVEVARRFAARLVLLTVLPAPSRAGRRRRPAGGDPVALLEREEDARHSQAEGYLEGLARSLQTAGLQIESVVGNGDPASVILATAAALEQPLIVITSLGRAAPQSMEGLGNVATEVLRRAPGPVMLVRPATGRGESAG